MNTPKIRFKGFIDSWEQRNLGSVLIKNSKKNKDLAIDNVESVSNKAGFTKQTEQFEDYSVASSDLSNYYVISENQFAYNPSRINVGSIAYKQKGEKTSVVSPLYVSFSTIEDLDDQYLWNWFKTVHFKHQRIRLSEGGVRDTLSFEQLSKMSIELPSQVEQTKIGEYFSNLDNLITLHQRKCDQTKKLKKYMLQKMFPQNGSEFPEIRFKGFTDAWEQRKFEDLCEMVTVGIANSATHAYSDHGVVMFRNQNIKPNYLDDADIIHIDPEFEIKYKNKRLKKMICL